MSTAELQAILPLLVLGIGAVILMLQISLYRHLGWSYGITLASLLLGGLAVIPAAQLAPLQVTPLLKADHYALFFSLLFCLSGAATSVLSREYLRARAGQNEEYFLLLLLSTLGAVTLVYATHLASLLLGLELLSVALYALIAYPDRGTLPLEAAIKYLVLSAAASSMLLFGFALLYAALGTMEYAQIAAELSQRTDAQSPVLLLAGAAMVFAGLGFKLSAAPFHMWTPDVYEGAPAPVTGFLAAVSKGAVFVAVMRWFLESDFYLFSEPLTAVAVLAAASILVGNLMALLQENVKRILAYSSIGHVGYLLIALAACGLTDSPQLAVEAASYYLVAYVFTSLAAFALLGLISSGSGERELDQRSDLQGLFWRQPLLATLFGVALLSLAGIPLTAGFVGKLYIFTVGIEAGLWWLLSVLVVGSAIGIFYYLRIIYTMSMAPAETAAVETDDPAAAAHTHSAATPMLAGSRAVVYLLIIAMLYFGILPEPLMSYLRTIL